MRPRLLVLSNGHGEDVISRRILECLRSEQPQLSIDALPLVGDGTSFAQLENVGSLGPRLILPSGGFSNQNLGGMLSDLKAGLLRLSLAQWRSIQHWANGGGTVLAVGDLLPLLMAWASGLPFGFIGTPKSDYTWRSGPGNAPLADAYHRLKGSEWDPWEWALMGSRRCRLVICRDSLTARGLRRHGVAALAPGNPMMDGFAHASLPSELRGWRRILVLPGSRSPEALANLERLIVGLRPPGNGEQHLLMLCCGNNPSKAELEQMLARLGYRARAAGPALAAEASWQGPGGTLLLGRGRFETWASWAEVGIACAGTATEQLVGLGCAALSLPGPGPQFQKGFAKRQSRLLGGAVRVCIDAAALNLALNSLLANAQQRQAQGAMGVSRMGSSGASARIAALLSQKLLNT
jgi:uncharacterized protein (TIGR03492 family)